MNNPEQFDANCNLGKLSAKRKTRGTRKVLPKKLPEPMLRLHQTNLYVIIGVMKFTIHNRNFLRRK